MARFGDRDSRVLKEGVWRLVIMGLWVRVWSGYIGNLGVGSVGFRLAGQNRIQRAPYKWAFILGRYV